MDLRSCTNLHCIVINYMFLCKFAFLSGYVYMQILLIAFIASSQIIQHVKLSHIYHSTNDPKVECAGPGILLPE